MDDVPECLSCGTCCFSTLERYVRVTGDDYERLGDRAESLTQFIGNRAYLRMEDGHCAALRVEAGRFVCTAYDARPAVCRDLERGSPECLGEIATKRDRSLVASIVRGDRREGRAGRAAG
jgi:Fe-S-cluster containining protein